MFVPKISIITPTYNAEKTILACIHSVANQSYHHIEHIIVDGLSTDNTLQIVEKFALEHPHIRYIHEQDKGIYDAMNKGIKMASGDWLYFLGSDDTLYDDQVIAKIFEDKSLLEYDVLYGKVFSQQLQMPSDGPFDAMKIVKKNICHQAIFFRKSLFTKTGFFSLQFPSHADWAHNLKWFLNDQYKIKYIPVVIAHYADGGYSSTHIDNNFERIKPLLVLKYDKGKLPNKWKAHWAKNFAKSSLKKKEVLLFIQYIFFFLKAKLQTIIQDEFNASSHSSYT